MSATSDYQAYAVQAAQANGVPVNMFLWQIGKESGWDPTIVNGTPGSTATGLGQFIQGTASQFGIDPTNPYQSLDAAAKYDAQLYSQNNNNWQAALTQYGTLNNASPQTMAQFQNALNGAPQTPQQYLDYYNQNGYAYTPPAAAGSAAATFQTGVQQATSSIGSYFNRGTFVVLGIVVVAIAILSNKQVQTIAVSTAKGA